MNWLRTRLAGIERRNLIIAAASVVLTTIVMTGFLIENRWGYSKPDPVIIYAQNWDESRSIEDVLADREREEEERKRREAEAKAQAQAEAQAKAPAQAAPAK